MRKYWAFFTISFNQALVNRWAAIGRFVFYGVILFVFSQLWKTVGRGHQLPLSPKDLVWYLAMTEWIVLSMPMVSKDIEGDVKSGNLAYFLNRPVSYLWSKYATAAGTLITQMLILAIAGFCFAFLFAGGLPENPFGLVMFFPLGICAALVSLMFHCIVGLTAFWTQDSFPVYLVWQKLLFVLGGMMLPLDIYPMWLQDLASYTPYPALLYHPAISAINFDGKVIGELFAHIFLWMGVAAICAQFVYSRAKRGVNLNGG